MGTLVSITINKRGDSLMEFEHGEDMVTVSFQLEQVYVSVLDGLVKQVEETREHLIRSFMISGMNNFLEFCEEKRKAGSNGGRTERNPRL